MKANEKLLSAIGEADEKWIPDMTAEKKEDSYRKWAVGGGICAALLIGFFLFRFPFFGAEKNDGGENAPKHEDLPKITAGIAPGSMGFEGLLEYSADELENGNPWREIPADISALPVYENLLYDEYEEPTYYSSEEELRQAAEDTAVKLGMSTIYVDVRTVEPTPEDEKPEQVLSVKATCQGENGSASIRVLRTGTIYINFDPPFPFDTDEEKSSALNILSDFLGYEDAVIAESASYGISWPDRTALRSIDRLVYENADNPVKKLLNYSLAAIRLGTEETEEGTAGLYAVTKNPGLDVIRYLGDFPIISEAESREMLLRGKYLTTVPAELLPESGITEDGIDRVELMYRTGYRELYVEPYYRYFVRLKEGFPEDAPEGISHWGVFYVPAVRTEYLAELPVWDGSFN